MKSHVRGDALPFSFWTRIVGCHIRLRWGVLLSNLTRVSFSMSPSEWLLQTSDEGEILPWLKSMEQTGVQCLEPQEKICDQVFNS